MKPAALALLLCLPLLGAEGVRPFLLSGDSMRPVLAPGAILTVDTRPEAFERVRPGSIVLYRDARSPKGITAHKVIKEVKPNTFWTKGTNKNTNPLPDPEYVTRKNFVGLVIAFVLPPVATATP